MERHTCTSSITVWLSANSIHSQSSHLLGFSRCYLVLECVEFPQEFDEKEGNDKTLRKFQTVNTISEVIMMENKGDGSINKIENTISEVIMENKDDGSINTRNSTEEQGIQRENDIKSLILSEQISEKKKIQECGGWTQNVTSGASPLSHPSSYL